MDRHTLSPAPDSDGDREQWLVNAAGFILFEDMRRYATSRIDPNVSPEARTQIEKGIDDAVYGLMMIIDGVTGILSNEKEQIDIKFVARHIQSDEDGEGTVLAETDLSRSDGMCGAFHGWKEGDFGEAPIVSPV